MYRLIQGNSIDVLKTLESASVQCCVTSTPYYGLRDYGTAEWEGGDPKCEHNPQKPDGGDRENRSLPLGRGGVYKDVCGKCGAIRIDSQIGLESSPEAFVEKLVQVFREVCRVLKDDGTLWLNLGDSYAGSWGNYGGKNRGYGKQREIVIGSNVKQKAYEGKEHWKPPTANNLGNGIKPKDLIGIPWMVAFALRADGWYLRQDIIWAKPNPMPESVRDRCTKSHEYIFLLTKSAKYYYDYEAILEPANYDGRKDEQFKGSDKYKDTGQTFAKNGHARWNKDADGNRVRNKRSVWTVTTKPYKEAHFATFPPDLIEPCILAGSRKGDVILDPFNGAGTSGVVSVKNGRDYIGIDLNPDYIKMSERRISDTIDKMPRF